MPRTLAPAVALAALLLAGPAFADRPLADALPLSEILRMLEQERDVAWFDEIDWDDDGYWDIEYVDGNGREIEIEVDPRTGRVRD